MAENSSIEWTDHTFNPWVGCTKVSPGCDHCYAETLMDTRWQKVQWGPGNPRQRTSEANWRKPLAWQKRAAAFYAEHGRRQRVFCASLADWADNAVPIEWLRDLCSLVELTPDLDWLMLTKRIGIVFERLSEARSHDWLAGRRNVALGITVVNQEEVDRDVIKLLRTQAHRRFLSVEPMLGPINLRAINRGQPDEIDALNRNPGRDRRNAQVDWVICGGESGNGARPMHPDWARSLRNQCEAAGTPFLFKQHGEYSTHEVRKGGDIEPPMPMSFKGMLEWRRDLKAFRLPPADAMASDVFKTGAVIAMPVGKKAAGRTLDGVLHDGYPS